MRCPLDPGRPSSTPLTSQPRTRRPAADAPDRHRLYERSPAARRCPEPSARIGLEIVRPVPANQRPVRQVLSVKNLMWPLSAPVSCQAARSTGPVASPIPARRCGSCRFSSSLARRAVRSSTGDGAPSRSWAVRASRFTVSTNRAERSSRSTSHTAARISDEGSFRPRSISLTYGSDTRDSTATSRSVLPSRSLRRRKTSPRASRSNIGISSFLNLTRSSQLPTVTSLSFCWQQNVC